MTTARFAAVFSFLAALVLLAVLELLDNSHTTAPEPIWSRVHP